MRNLQAPVSQPDPVSWAAAHGAVYGIDPAGNHTAALMVRGRRLPIAVMVAPTQVEAAVMWINYRLELPK